MENTASGARATVGGGERNRATATTATVVGGYANTASGFRSSVSGGELNTASGPSAIISGGDNNSASGFAAAIGGGEFNAANGNNATVPGGLRNTATNYAFAAGRQAKAIHPGAFVWADSRGADFASTAPDQFLIRADFTGINRASSITSSEVFGIRAPVTNDYGGMYMETAGTGKPFYGYAQAGVFNSWTYVDGTDANKWKLNVGGAGDRITVTTSGNVGINTTAPTQRLHVIGNILASGTITGSSDRNVKENFAAVNPRDVLDKVAALPITRWNYKVEGDVTHLGPMAQDFYSAFAVGMDDKHISMVDADGVALAAIQGLNQKVEEKLGQKETEITELKRRLQRLEQLIDSTCRGAK